MIINLKKSVFCKATVTYLGHVVGNGNVRPKTANIEAVLEYPVPTTRKSLQRFLGLASYYRRFCRNFSTVAAPLLTLPVLRSNTSGMINVKPPLKHLNYSCAIILS